MKRKRLVPACLLAFLVSAVGVVAAAAGSDTPTVHMRVTLPDGQNKEIAAQESGIATIALGDGTMIGVRPTIQDSKPWTRVVVTVFAMPTTSHASEELGEAEVKTGAAAASTKGTPAFKIAVTAVSASS